MEKLHTCPKNQINRKQMIYGFRTAKLSKGYLYYLSRQTSFNNYQNSVEILKTSCIILQSFVILSNSPAGLLPEPQLD